jgi:hypothetical protein
MKDYTICYKEKIENNSLTKMNYDYFISAHNLSYRVKKIFNTIGAKNKHRLIFNEYKFKHSEISQDEFDIHFPEVNNEVEFFRKYLEEFKFKNNSKICIDITGFIRPYMIVFINFLLKKFKIDKFDIIYSEPFQYKDKSDTKFSSLVKEVIIIPGCSSEDIKINENNDILIIASGYDDKLIDNVVSYKKNCKKIYNIIGFPSLSPDMYQENILRLQKVDWGGKDKEPYIKFAPANDPFVTAQTLKEILKKEKQKEQNIYISPLSSKPQVLGFLLFYLWEGSKYNVNIIYPYSENYKKETSVGMGNIYKYSIILPNKP